MIETDGMLTEFLKGKTRKTVYTVYAILGVVLGAVQVGFAAAAVASPVALVVALAVYTFLGGAIGFTANRHVPGPKHRAEVSDAERR